MALHKTLLRHQSDNLIIGVGLYQRFLLLGFGVSLTLLSITGILRLLSHGGLAAAILLPVLAVMVLVGLLALYLSFTATNDVYDKQEDYFLRYSGNLLTGKRVVLRVSLDQLETIEHEQEDEDTQIIEHIHLRTQTDSINISDYTPAAVQAVERFLWL